MAQVRLSAGRAAWNLVAAAAVLTGVLATHGDERDAVTTARAQDTPAPAADTGPDPEASLNCYVSARNELQLADRTAFLLCNGASSDGPKQCFAAARGRTNLLDWQIVNLCRCAQSAAPVGCVERGRGATFMADDQLVALCSATTTGQLRSNCAPFTTTVPTVP